MGAMNTYRHDAWQRICTHRLGKAAVVVKRHTSPLDGRKPSDPEWWEWTNAMHQALAFDIDPVSVIEARKMIQIDQAVYTPNGTLVNHIENDWSQWSMVNRAVRWRVALSEHFKRPYIVTDVNQVAALDVLGQLNVFTYTEEAGAK